MRNSSPSIPIGMSNAYSRPPKKRSPSIEANRLVPNASNSARQTAAGGNTAQRKGERRTHELTNIAHAYNGALNNIATIDA